VFLSVRSDCDDVGGTSRGEGARVKVVVATCRHYDDTILFGRAQRIVFSVGSSTAKTHVHHTFLVGVAIISCKLDALEHVPFGTTSVFSQHTHRNDSCAFRDPVVLRSDRS